MVVAQEKMIYQEPTDLRSDERNQRSVVKRKRHSYGKSIVLLAFIVGLTGTIGVEAIQLTVVKGAQVRALEKEISTLKEQKDLLQLEADKLRAVGRIESVALSMGMEKPTGTVYMAGTIPAAKNQTESAVKNQTGTLPPQAPTQTAEAESNTALHQFSKLFTSFFASTQR
ncbi:septum formation initiator [Desulfosporosinus sp. PR]|uniref:septum formation initiator n=1 Tax=Candidatus Desulfosporosinus nitrosoreducens TaxID=3401928 RepID=UPI0027EA6B97|nr:septum formation initiator [Desulfosporosinus sp. PR]MDQ7096169.1 septum formation initiator [Desulfosporosinus sp. PR]